MKEKTKKVKLGSLKYQLTNRFKELNKIGQSKHQAKQEYRAYCESQGIKWNPAKAEGIFSLQTMNSYRQSAMEFVEWIRETHPEIKELGQITEEHSVEYLQNRQKQGISAYSVSKDMSALNKVLGLSVSKKQANLDQRSYKNVTRSRIEREHDLKYNPKNYEKQIEFAKAFGCRRQSIFGGNYQVKDVSLFKRDGQVYVSLIEKGGRYREAPCLVARQKEIERLFPDIQERESMIFDRQGKRDLQQEKREFIKKYEQSENKLFGSYTAKIDNHAFRGEYARELYRELELKQENLNINYRGYDENVLRDVSEALGHSRLVIVVEHYLR